MSRLDSMVIILMVQITIPLLAALLLSFRRSHMASSRSLTWGAGAVLLLTLSAFLPRPWWGLSTRAEPIMPATTQIENSAPIEQMPTAPATITEFLNSGSSSDRIDLLKWVNSLQMEPIQFHPGRSRTQDWLASSVIVLASVSLLRFGIGWRTMICVRRQTHPLTDGALRKTLDELCEALSCQKRITLHESSSIGSAGTMGWRQPIILLSSNWRTWNAVERRAILAHEVAHVMRRDFLSRFLGHLVRAVHGYHPLVRWLIYRLELRQELAADALAAPCVGGRSRYLHCLASLALKADAGQVGMVPTFHSRPKILLRRIAMLQVMDDKRSWSRGWWSAAIIGVLSVLALGLHGQSGEAVAEPPTAQPQAVEQSSLDVSLLDWESDADSVGFYTVRLDRLFSHPGMKKALEPHIDATYGLDLSGSLMNIEQISGMVSLKVDANKPAPNHSLMLSLNMIRFKTDIDWANNIEKTFGNIKTLKHGDKTYFEVDVSKWLGPVLASPKSMNIYPLDKRTVVVLDARNTKKFLNEAKEKKQKPNWYESWRAVESSAFALMLTEPKRGKLAEKLKIDQSNTKASAAEKIAFEALQKICSKTDFMAFGVDLGDSLTFKIRMNASATDDLPMLSEQWVSIWTMIKAELAEKPKKADGSPLETAQQEILYGLMKQPTLRVSGKSLVIESASKESIKALDQVLEQYSSVK